VFVCVRACVCVSSFTSPEHLTDLNNIFRERTEENRRRSGSIRSYFDSLPGYWLRTDSPLTPPSQSLCIRHQRTFSDCIRYYSSGQFNVAK